MILRDSEVVEGACSDVLVTVTRVIQSPDSGVEADISLIHERAKTLNWESWVVVLASSVLTAQLSTELEAADVKSLFKIGG